jgi:hypothetical protein
MARKLRIEYPGAFYHLINRGNYRSWIFETEGTRHAFLLCLKECCEAKGDAAFKKRVLSLEEDGRKGRELVESETAEIGSYRWRYICANSI